MQKRTIRSVHCSWCTTWSDSKKSVCFSFLFLPQCELTTQVQRGSESGQQVLKASGKRRRVQHHTEHGFIIYKCICTKGQTSSHRVLEASLLCLGWRRCGSGRSHRPRGSWTARFWCFRRDSRVGIKHSDIRSAKNRCLCYCPLSLKKEVGLTLSSSSGRSPPSLMPRFMEMKRSTPGLSLTLGLWRLVFSIMMAKDST